MLFGWVRFISGIFGYGEAKRDQRKLRAELKEELALQRALSGGSRHQLSQLEREMKEAEKEAADN